MKTIVEKIRRSGAWASACVAIAVCGACTDQLEGTGLEQPQEGVSFTVAMSGGWNAAASRSAASGEVGYHADRFENSSLWLITADEEGIRTPMAAETASRAAEKTATGFYDSFALYGYVYEGSETDTWAENKSDAALYIGSGTTPETVTKSGSQWVTAKTYYWPGEDKRMKFFAYAPKDMDFAIGEDKNFSYTYTVPTTAAEQRDLLIADKVQPGKFPSSDTESNESGTQLEERVETISGGYMQPVVLPFRHILTAVRVKVGAGFPGTIESVKFSGVKGSGTYSWESNTWATSGEDVTYEATLNTDASTGIDSEDTWLVGNADNSVETTLILMPQALTTEAKLEVVATMDGVDKTLTAVIGGGTRKNWEIGHTITYTISLTEYVFEVEGEAEGSDEINFDYSGTETKSYKVKSYKITNNGEPQAVAWQMVGYRFKESDDWTSATTLPEGWINSAGTFTLSGSGGTEETVGNNQLTVANSEEVDHNAKLKSAQTVTSYDLSTQGGTINMSTANCYIVNAAGTYRFPLVYGNAIVNGKENPSSCYAPTSLADNTNVLAKFVNYKNEAIKRPWILEDVNCTSPDACLIWQDVQDMITNVSLSSDNKYIEFTVDQSAIKQGNAVIAVRDAEDEIMWSWHIWVTDYTAKEDKVVTNADNKIYNFMPINLGWCYTQDITYYPRSIQVKFKQEGKESYDVLTINQTGDRFVWGDAPFYQYGRKDPSIPIVVFSEKQSNNAFETYSKTTYWSSTEGYTEYTWKGVTTSGDKFDYATSILNPDKKISSLKTQSGVDWLFTTYNNLWNMGNANQMERKTSLEVLDERVVKTIYDPSPVGYCIPPIAAFSGFVTLNEVKLLANNVTAWGQSGNDYSTIRTPYTTQEEVKNHVGFEFYCTANKQETIHFPITGRAGFNAVNMQEPGPEGAGVVWSTTPAPPASGDGGSTANGARVWGFYVKYQNVLLYGNIQRPISLPARAIKQETVPDLIVDNFEESNEDIEFEN